MQCSTVLQKVTQMDNDQTETGMFSPLMVIGKHRTKLDRVTEVIMRDAAEKGHTLEQLSDPRIMDRSIRTLKRRARQFGLSFPDYTPRALRKKESVDQRGS